MCVTSIAAFQGDWQLERMIFDHGTLEHSTFSGVATFSPGDGNWNYLETGELKTTAGVFPASRSYLYQDREGGASVSFENGAVFHDVMWASPITHHLCPPDLYHVAYRFVEWPRWSVGWHVHGPRKHYSLSSHYTRP